MSASPVSVPASTSRVATHRHYLMCRPTFFDVSYEINPWMTAGADVDVDRAVRQWESLRDTYEELGHRVDVIEPVEGLPDMVFAANGGLVLDGIAYGSRFLHAERAAEGPTYQAWFTEAVDRGLLRSVVAPVAYSEGEGDFLVVGDVLLAGHGFRTDPAAHTEVARTFGRVVTSLELVDPRFYHLDTALAVLDERTVAYLPAAFSSESRAILERVFPGSIHVDAADALVLGLNVTSDGRNVVLPAAATGFAEQLVQAGFRPVPVDLREMLKAGGSVKCCTLELRP